MSLSTPVGSRVLRSRTMTPPGMSRVAREIFAARSAALLARPMCPSSRYTNTGLWGVTESIHSRRGNGASGQRSWSQFPPRIHSPGRRSAANALRRAMNSPGVLAGRRSTLASWKPPSVKCRWPSMNPGTTIAAPLVSTRVVGPTSGAMLALSPTARTVSPVTASAAAQGAAESPVQIRPYTTRSAGAPRDALPQARRPASANTRSVWWIGWSRDTESFSGAW